MLCYNILYCEGVKSYEGELSGRDSSVTARGRASLVLATQKSDSAEPRRCQLHEARHDLPFFRETPFRSETNSRWIITVFQGELGLA